MRIRKKHLSNILFFLALLLLIIPQTRTPIQVFLQKGLALFSPTEIKEKNRKQLKDYHWQLVGLNGERVNFEQSKEKVIVINFWATWCPPCIAEMPSLEKLYEDYKQKVDFYFVSNEDSGVIKKFLEENNYTFQAHQPQSDYPTLFDISGIPRTFLIDKKGTVWMDKTGAANWNSEQVRKLLDRLLAEQQN